MTPVSSCILCGSRLPQYTVENGGFCNSCGMKFQPEGIPVFNPDELYNASQKGEEGLNELAANVQMPLANVKKVLALISNAANTDRAEPSSNTDNVSIISHQCLGTATKNALHREHSALKKQDEHENKGKTPHTRPPAGLSSLQEVPRPALTFSYEDAFYHNQSGEITLLLTFESEKVSLQDIKLTVDGDIARPFNANMEDFLGRKKTIVVTPTVFPASRLNFKLSAFDETEQPHCWKGDAVIKDVEQTLEVEGSQHIHLSSTGNVGDSEISIKGMESSQTLRRRALSQTYKCEVILSCDDKAEKRLLESSRADRIKARETLMRARNRAEKGKYEVAYKLIREVEEIGFMLHDAQELRAKIERELSNLSLIKGRELFEKGELKEAYEFLQERKSLIYNPDIINLLIEIEDIGEDCKDAAEYIKSSDLTKALELIQSVEAQCPQYKRCILLREMYSQAEAEKAKAQALAKEEHQKEEERIRLEVIEETKKKKLKLQLLKLETAICSAAEQNKWRLAFNAIGEYRQLDGSTEFIKKTLSRYTDSAALKPMARLAGPSDDEPDILLIGESNLPIGRDPRNTIVLIDSSSRTGRSQGRIIRSAPDVWEIQRCRGDFGSSVQAIAVNDRQLEVDESVKLNDKDILTFSDVVKIQVSATNSPKGDKSLELAYSYLLPDDDDYLNLAKWILMNSSIEIGGKNSKTANLTLPDLNCAPCRLFLAHDIFWLEPERESTEISINDKPLKGPTPLFHNEVITFNDHEYYFYQLCSPTELWLSEEELDDRDLPQ